MTPNPASSFRIGRRSLRIENIRLAALLSLLLHALLFWSAAPDILLHTLQPFEETKDGKPAGSLAVRLAPPTSRHSEDIRMTPRAPVLESPRSIAARPAPVPRAEPQAPRVLSREKSPTPSASVAPPVPQAQPGAPGDLAAYIESRRRAREPAPASPSPPTETEQERDNRVAAENLGFNRVPTFGAGRRTGGGVFQIAALRYDSAEFFFFGWNKQIRRNAQQMIEVQRGSNPSIELAVVRRMIAIIRDQSTGDFTWESMRLRRDIQLSARPADNAGLEDFLLKEFFPDYRPR
jgi:hypothetical protein